MEGLSDNVYPAILLHFVQDILKLILREGASFTLVVFSEDLPVSGWV